MQISRIWATLGQKLKAKARGSEDLGSEFGNVNGQRAHKYVWGEPYLLFWHAKGRAEFSSGKGIVLDGDEQDSGSLVQHLSKSKRSDLELPPRFGHLDGIFPFGVPSSCD
jgi:hypothetical protein